MYPLDDGTTGVTGVGALQTGDEYLCTGRTYRVMGEPRQRGRAPVLQSEKRFRE